MLTGSGARAGVPKVMIVISDGAESYCGSQSSTDCAAIAAASVAKSAGTKVIAAGFGNVIKETLIAMASFPAASYTLFTPTAKGLYDILVNNDVDLCKVATETHAPTDAPTTLAPLTGGDSYSPTKVPTWSPITPAPTPTECVANGFVTEYDAAPKGQECSALHVGASVVTSKAECEAYAVKHGFTFEDGTCGYPGAYITGCGQSTDACENNVVAWCDSTSPATDADVEPICKFAVRCTACSYEYAWGTEGQLCSDIGPEDRIG